MDVDNDTTLKGTVILAQSSDCVVGAAPFGASEKRHDENESKEEDGEDDEEDDEDDDEEEVKENVDAGGDMSDLDKSKKLFFNPELTWDYFKNARVHNDKFQAGGQPVEVTIKPRERIKKVVIRTIIDFLTSEEVQQSVAFGTILVKGPDGVKVRIAHQIRKRHDAELIRQVRVRGKRTAGSS